MREHVARVLWLTTVWVLLWGSLTPVTVLGGLAPEHPHPHPHQREERQQAGQHDDARDRGGGRPGRGPGAQQGELRNEPGRRRQPRQCQGGHREQHAEHR